MRKVFAWLDVEDWGETTKLLGEFSCRMTEEDQNEFHEHAVQTDEFKRLEKARLSVNIAYSRLRAGDGNESQYGDAEQEYRNAREACYEMSKAWYAGLLERRRQRQAELRAAKEAVET
jgi:hypothetical protein